MDITPGGSIVTCDIALVGDNDLFRFWGRQGERVEVVGGVLMGPGVPLFSLRDPDGIQIASTFLTSGTSLFLPKTGSYSIVISEFLNDALVSYSLSVERARPSSSSARPIGYGESHSSEILLQGDLVEYFFRASAGDSITLFAPAFTGPGVPYIKLYDPNGVLVGQNFGSTGLSPSLTVTGVYTILVSEFINDQTASFRVTLQCTAGSCVSLPRRLLIGLGPGGLGYLEDMIPAPPHPPRAWLRVNWPAYANTRGETRPAFCDVDGDGRDEVVLGLGPFAPNGGWLEVKDDATTGYATLAWIRIDMATYNVTNGETYPACGDVDNDFKDEIIVGLGPGGGGWVKAFDDATTGFAPLPGTPQAGGWIRTSWPSYNAADGAVHPAVGNLDHDSSDEIVFGLGLGGAGWIEILDDAQNGLGRKGWRHAGTPNTIGPEIGEHVYTVDATWPAIGDLNGDRAGSHLVVGLGPGSGGWLRVFGDLSSSLAPAPGTPTAGGWLRVSWTTYNDSVGTTYPAVGDIDGDDRAELVVGLANNPPNGGWLQVFEDLVSGISHKSWARIAWPPYNSSAGLARPAIGPR
jgi:hypothetical protein